MIEIVALGLLIGTIIGACDNSCNSQRIAEKIERDRDKNRDYWKSWHKTQLEKLNCPDGQRSRGIMGNMKKEGIGYPTEEQEEIKRKLGMYYVLMSIRTDFEEKRAQELADASGLTAYLKKHKADEKR